MDPEKKKTKIKKLRLTSVDMVRRGANQDAYINLYKNEAGAPGGPESEEIPQNVWKSIRDFVKGLMSQEQGQESPLEETEPLTKSEEVMEELIAYQEALQKSVDSIIQDTETDAIKKAELVEETLEQFKKAYTEACATVLTTPEDISTPEPTETIGKGEREMKIDKSRFNEEELKTYEALIAKGLVDDNDPRYVQKAEGAMPKVKEEEKIVYEVDDDSKDEDEMEVEVKGKAPQLDKSCKTKKSAEMHPEVKKALEEVAELKKSIELNELKTIAKKYEPLGKKSDELAFTLYDMKKSGESTYNDYIALLDESLDMVNKSGMFAEIGKSARGMSGGSTVEKIEAIATDIQKSDSTMSRLEAVNKAWELHPELIAEYEQEYK